MQKMFPFIVLPVIMSCVLHTNDTKQSAIENSESGSDTNYVWTKVLDSTHWKKSYNFQMFSIKDTLWTFHPDGNWYSTDGKDWTKSTLPNAIYNLAFLDYVLFKDAVWGFGHFEGNIEHFTLKPEIYKTTDFKKWDTVSKKSNLPRRFFYHPFVFDDKIWIIGGEDKDRQYADIWNSADGIQWTKIKDNLPFGKRSGSQIVSLHNTLFLIDFDVWQSTDALNWHKVTDAIIEHNQVSGNAVVYDNKIWLLGCNRNEQFTSQVLYSSDGKNWQAQHAPWLPRGGVAATVYKNKIYMTGGKYGGTPNHPAFRYDNDLWTLEKK
ncbi:MAG TPA: hypothetical protein VHD35_15880 [Chitinophagaceae bacterium]|nr:hypothetical protein [Chitinophagaceae bacterium]